MKSNNSTNLRSKKKKIANSLIPAENGMSNSNGLYRDEVSRGYSLGLL